jgi:hypothetical protein
MNDGKIIITQAGNLLNEALAAGLLSAKEKTRVTVGHCIACNKPTRSHKYGPLSMCHLCWEHLTPEQTAQLDVIVKEYKLEETHNAVKQLLLLMTSWKNCGVMYCKEHDHVLNETSGICPGCDTEHQADEDATGAQAEYEAACRERAEFEDQQAADEAYYHNRGGPEGY